MHDIVKQYADKGDIDNVRFTFLSSLDIDPTFEVYKEDFEYCKKIPGIFEGHKELKPFERNPVKWDEDYWVAIKMDMQENFSIKRFEHMKEVAKVYYADKVERLKDERREAAAVKEASAKAATEKKSVTLQSPSSSCTQIVRTSSAVSNEPAQEQVRETVIRRYSEPRISENQEPENQQQGGGAPPKQNRVAIPIIVVAVLLVAILLIILLK